MCLQLYFILIVDLSSPSLYLLLLLDGPNATIDEGEEDQDDSQDA